MPLTSKKYPTSADAPMANEPQAQIRSIAFMVLEPPAAAAIAPDIARNTIEKPY